MKLVTILFAITILLGIAYSALDRELFYYGKNDFKFYHRLPLGIKPDDRPAFENGFALKDGYGLTIAAKGNTYKLSDKELLIDSVLSYCFGENKVVARIKDKNNIEYYIEFIDGNIDNKENPDVIANIWDDNNVLGAGNFECIDLKKDERKIKRLMYARNYLMLFLIILIIITVYKTIRQIKMRI